MYTIETSTECTYRDKASKFIGILWPTSTPDQLTEKLQELRRTYYDATHICFGARFINPQYPEKYSDDGEPKNTAGLPIFNQLKSADLFNCTIFVVRYFGGTKLGKSGLIEAYRDTARQCIANANIKLVVKLTPITFAFNYSDEGLMRRYLEYNKPAKLEKVFNNNIEITAYYNDEQIEHILDYFNPIPNISVVVGSSIYI